MNLIELQRVISEKLNILPKEAETIVIKAHAGQEFSDKKTSHKWLNERFLPNIVTIDEEGYAKMCTNALKTVGSTVATDFGSSRQRDFGQIWSDKIRGYLAEHAFTLFLNRNWNIIATLDHEQGDLQKYLPSDTKKRRSNKKTKNKHRNKTSKMEWYLV